MIEFVTLQAALDDWPAGHARHLGKRAARLASAMDDAASGGCGPGDLAALIRDALREWQLARSSDALPAPLRVPAIAPWPDPETWRFHGVAVAPGTQPAQLRITSVWPWRPAWLDERDALDAFAAGRELRWPSHPVQADPAWWHA